jgi:Zn-dependent alcohol dehydrogenase
VRFYDFNEINQAVEDTRRGETVKAVLRALPVPPI